MSWALTATVLGLSSHCRLMAATRAKVGNVNQAMMVYGDVAVIQDVALAAGGSGGAGREAPAAAVFFCGEEETAGPIVSIVGDSSRRCPYMARRTGVQALLSTNHGGALRFLLGAVEPSPNGGPAGSSSRHDDSTMAPWLPQIFWSNHEKGLENAKSRSERPNGPQSSGNAERGCGEKA